jgi:hypothetical protein
MCFKAELLEFYHKSEISERLPSSIILLKCWERRAGTADVPGIDSTLPFLSTKARKRTKCLDENMIKDRYKLMAGAHRRCRGDADSLRLLSASSDVHWA